MKKDSQQKEFITYFQMLQEQPNSSYTHNQFVKLKKYLSFLSDCFMWKHRNVYLKLFQSFTNFSISGDEFTNQFFSLQSEHVTEFNQLIDELEISFEPASEFPIDTKAFGFDDILIRTYEDCDAFVSDEDLENLEDSRTIGEIDENQLRLRIEEAVSMIQKQMRSID